MPVNTRHPDYIEYMDEWRQMRDCLRGHVAIKTAGPTYLPMPSGFKAQSDGGRDMYRAYQSRARVPSWIGRMMLGMTGLVHRVDAKITMPDSMQYLWENATPDGLPLEALHRRITWEILLTARYSLLADVIDGLPYLAGYHVENMINWDKSRNSPFYVLDESAMVREGFTWIKRDRHRVLHVEDGRYVQYEYDGEDNSEKIEPRKRGAGGFLDFVPITVMNSRDLSLEMAEPPLIGVARAVVASYQLDADYRHQLYMSGQETLFTFGAPPPTVIGAGVAHEMPENARAEFVGPSGSGIDRHRTAIDDTKEDAIQEGAALFSGQSGQESGEALRIRMAATTATLNTISQTSAQGLEMSLRHAAIFLGEDPEKVTVEGNRKFVDATMSSTDAAALVKSWLDEGISRLTLFENLQRGEIISPDRTFEEEMDLIRNEAVDRPVKALPPSPPGNSVQPEPGVASEVVEDEPD